MSAALKRELGDVQNSPVKYYMEWNDLTRGDDVVVSGLRGQFNFMGYCTNLRSGESWVAVFGGSKDPLGVRGFRYLDPERVRKRRK